ncbi:MAG: trans-aconitate 2-methyltransferase [Rhizobiaceae bacterium]
MTDSQDHWEGVYRTKAETEVSWFQAIPAPSMDLLSKAGIGRESAIIDVGGGASTLADHLIDAGYRDVTVLDISASALAASRRRLGPAASIVSWVVADVTGWRPDRRYDLWHDRAVFHFLVTPEARAAYVATLRAALRPGGHVVIGTFALDGPEKCSGLAVQRYDAEGLGRELGAGFKLVDSRDHDHATPWGSTQKFSFGVYRLEHPADGERTSAG